MTVISVLQLSNWFTQKHCNKMLALLFLSEFTGYITPLNFIADLEWSVRPVIFWVGGSFMVLISILEWFIFAFHPLQKNIFLD